MNNKTLNIAVTGFYGTGSSAVIDLLREYEGVKVVPDIGRLYEHMSFYVSGGLFDLCTLLMHGVTPQGSDKVINNFIDAMRRLNDNDFGWFGSYKILFGNEFMRNVNEFVSSISEKRESSSSYHIIKAHFSPIKALLQIGASVFYKKKYTRYGIGYVFDKKPTYFAMPTNEELYMAAKRFTNAYFSLFNAYGDNSIQVFDHLIWPTQVDEQAECFDESLKIVITDRDPRDVYLSDKYIWSKPPIGHGNPHFPVDTNLFVEEWKRTVSLENRNPNVIRVHFEDLVYNYEKTVQRIENFLGLDSSLHTAKKTKFIPEKSIENTQVFTAIKEWSKEGELIKNKLLDFVYEFPCERQSSTENFFASPNS